MRYDWVLDKLLKEKSRHELAMQRILRRAIIADESTASDILGKRGPYKKRAKKMSKKMRNHLSKVMKAKHAAKKAGK